MPKTGNYHITVSFDGGEKKGPVAGTQGKTYAEKAESSLKKGVKGLVSFGAIKSTATQLIGHQFGTIELRTGAREYEQRQRFLFDRINEGVSNVGVLAVGAATGNLPAAVIGVAANAAGKLLGIIMRAHTLSLEGTIENVGIKLASIRAGAGSRRSAAQ